MISHRLAGLALGTIVAAQAGWAAEPTPRSTIVAGSYYEDNVGLDCEPAALCRVDFAKTPAGKRLTIENLVCNVNSTRLLLSALMTFDRAGESLDRNLPIRVESTFSSIGLATSFLSSEPGMLIGSRITPSLFISGIDDNQWNGDCKMIGALK